MTKALTLHQPWASLIATGHKSIETRSWSTRYRGPLFIHAAKSEVPTRSFAAQQAGYPLTQEQWNEMPFGALVASCQLLDVVPVESLRWADKMVNAWIQFRNGDNEQVTKVDISQRAMGDYTPGRFAWLLFGVTPITPPTPKRGKQGLWEVKA